MEPKNYDSAYNTTFSIKPDNLGNTPTQFAIEPSPTISTRAYSPLNYVALTDNVINIDKLDTGMISNIEESKPVNSDRPMVITKEMFENKNMKLKYEAVSQLNEPTYIAKFYLGSITVVGLYIFYRILVKNK